MFERGVWLLPAADPAGRAWLKLPVAYTVLPTTTCDQTTPLTCTVGSESAETVDSVTGGTGAVSASAGAAERAASGARVSAATSTAGRAARSDPRCSVMATPEREHAGDHRHWGSQAA